MNVIVAVAITVTVCGPWPQIPPSPLQLSVLKHPQGPPKVLQMKFSAELIYKSKPMPFHTRTHTCAHVYTHTNTSYLTPWQLSARWEMIFMGRDGMIRRQVEHLTTQSRKDNLEQQFYSRSYRRLRNSICFLPGRALWTSKTACSLRGYLVGNTARKIFYKKGLCSEGSSEPLAFPGFSFLPKPFLETEAFT